MTESIESHQIAREHRETIRQVVAPHCSQRSLRNAEKHVDALADVYAEEEASVPPWLQTVLVVTQELQRHGQREVQARE